MYLCLRFLVWDLNFLVKDTQYSHKTIFVFITRILVLK